MLEKDHLVIIKCRLFKADIEDVSAGYYLPMRHDMFAKKLIKEGIRKNNLEIKSTKEISESEYR